MNAPWRVDGARIALLAAVCLPMAAAAQDAVKGALQMERLLADEFRAGRADLQKAPQAAPRAQTPAPAPGPTAAPAAARAGDRGVDPAVLRSREVELAAARAEVLRIQKRASDLEESVRKGREELDAARPQIAWMQDAAAEEAQLRQKS
jgi:hypothetical protein